MSVRNTWQVGHTTAFVPHYFMPEGQFYAKRFLSVTGSHLWCCSDAMGLPASLLVRRPHCDRTIAPLGAEACQWLFSFPLTECLTMRHPELPKKLNNWLIINLGNLFVQKCDEVKSSEVRSYEEAGHLTEASWGGLTTQHSPLWLIKGKTSSLSTVNCN